MNFKSQISNLTSRLATLLAVGALALIAGCNGDESDANGYEGGGGGDGDRPTIAISIPSADHGWTGGVVYWANQAKEDFGDKAEIIIQTASGPDEQIRQIEDLMTRGVDAMVILAHESGPLTPVAEKAHERGIYLVNVDRGFTKPIADVYLAGDNAALGRKSAEFMVERMNGQGKIVILTGAESTVDTARVEAAMAVFNQAPGIEVLDTVRADWQREKAMNQMQTLLQKHSQIDAVWCQDDDMAEGVEQAIQEAGRTGIWVFGGAGKKQIVKRIMDGDEMFPATITYPPAMIYGGIAVAVAHLVDGDLNAAFDYMPEHLGLTKEQLEQAKATEGQKQITLDVFLITPENASEYYFPDSAY